MNKLGAVLDQVVSAASQASQPGFVPNLPAKAGPFGPPRLVDRDADYVIPARVWSNWIPAVGARSIIRELKSDERAALTRRESELSTALVAYPPLDEHRVIAAISSMLGGYRSMRHQDGDAVAILDGTRRVLAEFPAWAIERGCLMIQQGVTVLDRRYAPNDAEIYAVVLDVVKPYRDALRTVAGVLAAPIEPPPPKVDPIRRDQLVAEARKSLGIPPEGFPGRPGYAQRVAEDLARRRQSASAVCGND